MIASLDNTKKYNFLMLFLGSLVRAETKTIDY